MFDLLVLMLANSVPLLFAAFGGLLSESSGVINFALEGMMLSGAFAAVLGTFVSGSPWVGLISGVAAGGLAGAVHATACLKFRANQIVSAIAVNLLAAGLTGWTLNQFFGVYGTSPEVSSLPRLGHYLPQTGLLSSLHGIAGEISVLVPVAICTVGAVICFLKHSVPGLRLRACGENPEAAASAGLSVERIRFAAVCAGGALAGLGGVYMSIGELAQFVENMTHGRGYLAIAAIILGRWRPDGVLLSVLFFAFAEALSEWLSVRWSSVPNEVFHALPYAACFLILSWYAGKHRAPTALGRIV
ncbi:MAG: ABC transporter permease [Desulfobacteraceae bacterium]|nr:ABC transporter permease [Desulfobacteraceae bacterium]